MKSRAVIPNEVQQVLKSSTGFYQRFDGGPVGATLSAVKIMKDNAGKLPIKGQEVLKHRRCKGMLNLGVSRIGTSSAKQIILGNKQQKNTK